MSLTIQILEDVKNNKCTIEEAQKMIEQKMLEQNKIKPVSYKISPKGAISFYGIRRMPISLYLQELDKIMEIAQTDQFKTFVVDNKTKLSTKN